MDRIGVETIKLAYQQNLIENGHTDKAAELAAKELYEPILTPMNIHPEGEPAIKDMNIAVMDIGLDLTILDKEIAASGKAFASLMDDMKLRLDAVDQQLLIEEERLKDINILCGDYTEFDKVMTLTDADFEGQFSTEKNTTFMAYASDLKAIDIQIMQVRGNGYEGNAYVYTGDKFLKDIIDTSKQEFINDASIITAYEYSRLTADSNETSYTPEVNFDKEDAECGIVIGAAEHFNTVKVVSDFANVIVKDVLISADDGSTFTSALTEQILINSQDAKYESGAYAYGSGLICFPATKYLKIIFRSNGVTTDKIAFKNIDTTDAANPKETIVSIDSAKRHIVRINNIEARAGKFIKNTTLVTGELITSSVDSIAIFANEYIPEHFPSAIYFKYILNINGVDHEVVPINSQKAGIKIVKTSDYSLADTTIKHIDESIKSASLTVVIDIPNDAETPYLSNVKICFGKGETKSV